MLRTLWQTVKRITHNNVRFLPFAIICLAIFLIPLSINHHSLVPQVAEANWFVDAIMSGLSAVLGFILKIIAWIIFQITGLIFGIAGKIFDVSVMYSLSGSLYSSFGFINSGWVFIRDLVNSLFIFAVLFVAFKQLLSFGGVNDKEVKSAIVNIIIAALLINFSLFFTKAIIDVSNFTSRAIYYTMENKAEDGTVSYGPANALVVGLNVQKLLDQKAPDDAGNEDVQGEPTQLEKAITYLGGSVIHIVCSVIFFVMAFFFVTRILVLIIVMLTSPVFFLSFVINIPAIKKLKNDWQTALIGQAVFPVIFMLIIYIAVSFVNSGMLSGKTTGASFNDGINGGAGGFALVINFAIVIFLMIFATKMAKQYSGAAGSMGTKLAGVAAGAGFTAAAFTGRHTMGRLGGVIARSEGAKTWASSDNKFKRFVGDKVIISGGKAMQEGTWDVRSSKMVGQTYGAANKQTFNVNAGKATTRNAKVNVREFQSKALGIGMSKEGLAKEAVFQTGKIQSYDTLGARIAETKSRLGETINNKEYKEYREKLITEIQTANKEDPHKQKEIISQLLGDTAYAKPDYDKLRAGINMEISKKDVKDSAKKVGEAKRTLDTKRAELKAEQSKPTPNPAMVASINSEITKAAVDVKTHTDKFTASAKVAPPNTIREVAARDIIKLQDQLSKAHLAAINGKMAAGEYEDPEDQKALNEMIRQKRLDPNTPREIVEWINNQAMKDAAGFDLNFNKELVELTKNLSTQAGAVKAENQKKILDIIRVITEKEISLLSAAEITNDEILANMNPTKIHRYAKRMHGGDDEASKTHLHNTANEIESGTRLPNITPHERQTYVAALRGDNKLPPRPKPPTISARQTPMQTPPLGQAGPSLGSISPARTISPNIAARPNVMPPPNMQSGGPGLTYRPPSKKP